MIAEAQRFKKKKKQLKLFYFDNETRNKNNYI